MSTDEKKYVGKIDCNILGKKLVRVTGATSPEENKLRVQWVKTLATMALKDSRDAIATLQAIRSGKLTINDAYTAPLNPKVLQLVTGEKADAPLWATIDAWLDGACAPTPLSRKALRERLQRLPQACGIARDNKAAMISDLQSVDWEDRWMQHWEMYSTHSWNGTREATSAFLTAHFGGLAAKQRTDIMQHYKSHKADKMPKPRLGQLEFLAILDHVEETYRAIFMVLAMTGLRLGELIRLERGHLVPQDCGIKLKKKGERRVSKTSTGTHHLITVPAQYWSYVEQAIPVPTRPAGELSMRDFLRLRQRFSKAWKRAVIKAGRPDLTPHHLRTAYIRWNVKAGVPVEVTQRKVRHSDIQQTMDYYNEEEQLGSVDAIGVTMDAAFAQRAVQQQQIAGHIGAKVG